MKTIKRTLAVVLTLLMLIGVVPVSYATSKTADEAITWVKSQEGKALDYDGMYGAQCVDLAMYYYKFLGVNPVSGNGKDYATNSLPSGWTRTKGGTPQKGDLLVYSGNSSNTYGHVAIFESTKVIWHGRYSGTGKVQKTTNIRYDGFSNPYWGCIHPNFASAQVKVNVTFNGNGGTPSKSSETFTVGEKYGDSMPSALRNGYSFDGWYTSATGGTWCGKNTVAQSSVTTLYAHWSKNNTDVLQVGHIYKIYNKKSGLPLQTNGQGAGAYVCQREESNTTKQLWRVTDADADGYYSFESLYSCNAMDMDGTPRYDYFQHLQLWTPNDSDAQKFSLVKRGEKEGTSGYYTIHSKNSGRSVDVQNPDTIGSPVIQYDATRSDDQLFYFVEITNREVYFFDNFNNNYLPSPKEVYDQINSSTPQTHYASRDTSYVTVIINPTEDSLTINQIKAGSASAGDMRWIASINGSYAFDNSELNDSTVSLHFKAKSSVAGAKMYFRWGWDTSNIYSVTLSTAWTDYELDLPRNQISGNNLHPFIDKACTVEMKEIALYENGETGYIGDTDSFSVVRNDGDIYDAQSCLTPLPTKTKEGYTFEGWYTKRIGGTKVAEGNDYFDVSSMVGGTNLYAHWVKNIAHTHNYVKTVKAPTCTEQGYTTYVCSICGDSYSDNFIAAVGHDYKANVKEATCTQGGYTTYVCSDCGDTYIDNVIDALDHNFIEDEYVAETCTKDGYTKYQCSRCSMNYKDVISALGHQDADDNGYCDLCSKELRSHDDPTNPTNPTSPTEPATPSQPQGNICKWCGKTHDSGFIQKLIGFFHNILASIFDAKY